MEDGKRRRTEIHERSRMARPPPTFRDKVRFANLAGLSRQVQNRVQMLNSDKPILLKRSAMEL